MQPINAAPFTVYQGFDDESTRAQAVDPIATPTHLPLFPIYASWGPTDATIQSASSLTQTYGEDTFNLRKPYYSHQTLFAQTVSGQGNQIAVQRLLPADIGPKARLLLSLDIVADSVQQYQRNSDGTFALDNTGKKIPITGAGATLPGYVAKWVVNQWLTGEGAETFGNCASRQGSLVSSVDSSQSTLYPILELEATFFGSKGNLLGARLIAPTGISTPTLDVAQAERVKSFLYQLQFVQRSSAVSSPTTIATQAGSQMAQFSFLPGAYDVNTDQNLDFQTVLRQGWSVHDVPSNPPVYGPFENAKVYTNYLETVLAMIGAKEAPLGTLPVASMDATSDQLYAVNPFTGVNFDGVPYYTLEVQGQAQGGAVFSTASTFFAQGATDGTMTPASYDADVGTWADGFDLLDMAKYPFTFMYDSGFSLATKKKLMPILGARPDVAIIFSTQSALDPQNTADEDASVARSIAAALAAYPESTFYGTAVCRAMIVGSSGYLLNSNYTGLVPLSLQIAKRFAAYMGAGNGIWNNAVRPDEYPYNVVDMFRGVNAAFKTALVRSQDWNTGLVWVENMDIQTQYFPALASVYNNDTSILKGFLNVAIGIDLVKIAHAARRQLSGISGLTDEQFAQRSDALIQSMVKGKYDGRVSIIPKTFYSKLDQTNGYSWSVTIDMYGNNMRTVGSAQITARRMSDLPTS